VLAAQDADRYIGYAFVRVRSGTGFADSWSVSDPLAELATLAGVAQTRYVRAPPAIRNMPEPPGMAAGRLVAAAVRPYGRVL
jgi:hypothetical protein